MNVFEKLAGLYSEIDGYYAGQELACSHGNMQKNEVKIARNRELNDHLRNKIGHGGDFSTPVSIPTVVNDFSQFYEMMKTIV